MDMDIWGDRPFERKWMTLGVERKRIDFPISPW